VEGINRGATRERVECCRFLPPTQISAKYFSRLKTEYMHLCDKPEVPSTFVKIQPPIQTTQSAPIHLHYKNACLQIPSSVSSTWLANFLGLLP